MNFAICDGSCLKNPGRGGWAFGQTKNGRIIINYDCAEHATNNQMELMAVIKALELCPGLELIYTDSRYLVDGATKWMDNWKKKGWIGFNKKPIANIELWQKIDQLIDNVKLQWIPGHAKYQDFSDPDERFRVWLQNKIDLTARNAATEMTSGVDEFDFDQSFIVN